MRTRALPPLALVFGVVSLFVALTPSTAGATAQRSFTMQYAGVATWDLVSGPTFTGTIVSGDFQGGTFKFSYGCNDENGYEAAMGADVTATSPTGDVLTGYAAGTTYFWDTPGWQALNRFGADTPPPPTDLSFNEGYAVLGGNVWTQDPYSTGSMTVTGNLCPYVNSGPLTGTVRVTVTSY